MPDSIPIKVQYFAVFREQRGLGEESLVSSATTPATLYAELAARHGFSLAPGMVRAAINGAFAPMDLTLAPGDTVVFIPPVAGG